MDSFWQGWSAAVEAAKARVEVLFNEVPLTTIHKTDRMVAYNTLCEIKTELQHLLENECPAHEDNVDII